ncbi:hypothetical protein EDD21DRAFT_378271 [Dissophora ornata]|nr:hypothetical protein EDD21DRAFT_378271 [Dissophora ornata]
MVGLILGLVLTKQVSCISSWAGQVVVLRFLLQTSFVEGHPNKNGTLSGRRHVYVQYSTLQDVRYICRNAGFLDGKKRKPCTGSLQLAPVRLLFFRTGARVRGFKI